ncbi:hypothetical protein ACFXG4_22950 [Nocardia sp. NPDC059246]|uniref:hypothetical protein n=1 Tax=unclassified Nocardia TaxID=2637762 RepID=UPI0036CC1A67
MLDLVLAAQPGSILPVIREIATELADVLARAAIAERAVPWPKPGRAAEVSRRATVS